MKVLRSALVAAAVALAGCAVTKPADRLVTMRLSPALPVSETSRIADAITVAPVHGRGLASATRYTYIDAATPSELRQAATLRWEESPTTVVERALTGSLRTRFASVASAATGLPTGRRVVAYLDRFEETGAGGAARATVAIDVTVTGKPLLAGRYCASAPVLSASSTDRARAFESAIASVVARFTQDFASGELGGTTC